MTEMHISEFPLNAGQDGEYHQISISTNSNGDGSAELTFDRSYASDSDYVCIPTAVDDTGNVSLGGPATGLSTGKGRYIKVRDAASTDSSVTVHVLVFGEVA